MGTSKVTASGKHNDYSSDSSIVSNTYEHFGSKTCTYRGKGKSQDPQDLRPKNNPKNLGPEDLRPKNNPKTQDPKTLALSKEDINMDNITLDLEQETLENLMTNLGESKALKEQERLRDSKDPIASKGHLKIIEGAVALVSRGLLETLDKSDNCGRGKNPSWIKPLRDVGVDHAAYIGLLGCFSALSSDHDFAQCASLIGKMIEDELWARALKEQDSKGAKRLRAQVKGGRGKGGLNPRPGTTMKGRKSRAKPKRPEDNLKVVGWKDWSVSKTRQVGMAVLNAVLRYSGVFDLQTKQGSPVQFLILTGEAREFLTDLEADTSWIRPVFLPMIVPPRPWTSVHTGCYLSKEIARRVKLVRTYDDEHRQVVEEHIKSGRAKEFLDGINRIQATPYRVNQRVLEIVKWAFTEEILIESFPRKNLLELPVFPSNFDEMEEMEQRAVNMERREIHEMNRSIISEQAAFRSDLHVADLMVKYPRFYLPHNADFRGRVYPIPHFNHQRADHIKALFQFAEGKALGPHGGKWLAIHLANVGDFEKISKKSFKDRQEWVKAHEEDILAVAKNPQENLWWTEADKPFSFLAACFEYAGYKSKGPTFVSHLPIALDGSNSGIQHYSAALRSHKDAQHVNLVPLNEPADFYQVVADKVASQVDKDAGSGDALAQRWKDFGVSRSIVKRPVMTFAYSAEAYGFRQQILDDLMRPLARDVLQGKLKEHPFGDWKAQADSAQYLAKLIYGYTVSTVADAATGMRFFQSCARALAHEGKATTWTNPVGFPVIHKYLEWTVKRVELFLYTRSVRPKDAKEWDEVTEDGSVFQRVQTNMRSEPTKSIKKDKQRSAIAPNVIHSLDSAHLIHTVNKSWEDHGIVDFSLIHDSFATHAGNTEEFFGIIREAFIEMYEKHDIFATLYDSTVASTSEKTRKKIPLELPQKGDLELSDIRNALYAFA